MSKKVFGHLKVKIGYNFVCGGFGGGLKHGLRFLGGLEKPYQVREIAIEH